MFELANRGPDQSIFGRTAVLRSPQDREVALAPIKADIEAKLGELRGTRLFTLEDEQAGGRFFQEWKGPILLTLFARSLPNDYACPRGVEVLGLISALFGTPVRRAGETARYLYDVFAPDADWAKGDAITSIAGLRFVHRIVRDVAQAKIPPDPVWVPMNLEDLLGTALSFACPAFELLDQFGFRVSDAERNSYTRSWLVLAHLQGVPLCAITAGQGADRRLLNHSEAMTLARAIRDRQQGAIPDFHGVRLMEAMTQGLEDAFLRPFAKRPVDLIRVAGKAEVNDLLLVPDGSPTWQSLFRSGIRMFGRLSMVRRGPIRSFYKFSLRVFGDLFTRYIEQAGFGRPYRRDPGSHPNPPKFVPTVAANFPPPSHQPKPETTCQANDSKSVHTPTGNSNFWSMVRS